MVTTATISVVLWATAALVAAGCGLWLRDQRTKLHQRVWVRVGTRPHPDLNLDWLGTTFTTLPSGLVAEQVSVGTRGPVQLVTFNTGSSRFPYPVGQGRFVVLASIPPQPCGRIVIAGIPDDRPGPSGRFARLARRLTRIGAGSGLVRLPEVAPMRTGTNVDVRWRVWAQNPDAAARMVTHPQITAILDRAGPAAAAGGYTLEVTDEWVCATCHWEDADPTVADEGHGVTVVECAVAFATTLHGLLARTSGPS